MPMFNKFKALFSKSKSPQPPPHSTAALHTNSISLSTPPPPSPPLKQTQTQTHGNGTQKEEDAERRRNNGGSSGSSSKVAGELIDEPTTQVIRQDAIARESNDEIGINYSEAQSDKENSVDTGNSFNSKNYNNSNIDSNTETNNNRTSTTTKMHMENELEGKGNGVSELSAGQDSFNREDDGQDLSFTISDITLSSADLSYSVSSSCSSSSSSFSSSTSGEDGSEGESESENTSLSRSLRSSSSSSSPPTKLKRHHKPAQATPRAVFKEQGELPDYTLIKKIGEGAFSKVFKAVPNPENFLARNFKEVAVKVIKKSVLSKTDDLRVQRSPRAHTHGHHHRQAEQQQQQLSPTSPDCKPSTREQVLKEVRLHKSISAGKGCPYIVQFIEFKETKSYYYIVQEYLRGGEVFNEIVKFTYFSENLSRHITRQLALAIKHLHSLGIVHRDIKPENLLFNPIEYIPSRHPRLRRSDDPNTKLDEGLFRPNIGGGGIGVVKLADFGLSKQIFQTNTKTPCGTVGYTAPEVVKDERYSMKVDMWGIGCVLYTMLCGFPPFFDDKINILTEKISRGEYTFLSPWWDEISDGAKSCVSRLLEVDPDKRYNVDELLADSWLNRYDLNAEEMELELELEQRQRQREKQKQKQRTDNTSKAHKRRLHSKPVDSTLLYSPAAVAMRDAFDISNALQRDEEERARRHSIQLNSLNEGEEVTEFGDAAAINGYGNLDEKLFQLKLSASTIVKRRKQRQERY